MIAYFIDSSGEIRSTSTKLDFEQADYTKIISSVVLSNPANYKFDGTEFVEKLPVPHSVSAYEVKVGSQINIQFHQMTNVIVRGPGILQSGETEVITFTSQRVGDYIFDCIASGFKKTSITVRVY